MKLREFEGYSGEKQAGTLVGTCLVELGLAAGLNRHKIFDAWDSVSGAASYTLGRSFRNGCLYVRLSSSVVRSRLYPRIASIAEMINAAVTSDPLFTRASSDLSPVKKIILQ